MNDGLYPSATGRFTSAELPVVQNNITISVTHGLNRVPRLVRWVLVCKKAEIGYAPGMEVDLVNARDSSNGNSRCTIGGNGTAAFLVVENVNNWQICNFATQAFSGITIANWAFKCYCE